MMHQIKLYYSLTKSGIIYGNAVTVLGAFFLASHGILDLTRLCGTIFGIAFVIASAGVFNNIIDRDIDAKMERTKNRALALGRIPPRNAFIFGVVLGVFGLSLLYMLTNTLTAGIALFGFFAYVFLYSLWTKRHTPHATMIGTLSGAVPPLVGYVAVSGRIDTGAIIVFGMLLLWQMPHALAIALYRHSDYEAAAIPIFPIRKGIVATKIQMLFFTILFVASSLLLPWFGYVGYVYLAIAFPLGVAWIIFSILGFFTNDDKRWGKKMFFYSLIILMAVFVAMGLDTKTPDRAAPVMAPIA